MSFDFLSIANAQISSLQPYQTGKPIEELQRELGLERIVKLASNENPCGISEKVQQALQDHLHDLARYPDGAAFELKQVLAQKLQVDAAQITLGNGSNEVLNLIGLCFLNPETEVIFSQHSFVVYPLMAKFLGAKAVEVPAKNWGYDLDGILAAITSKTRVIFIANPNNPTGTWLGHKALQNFLQQVPEQVLVVIDEAYTEYIPADVDYADGLALQKQFANVIVTRSLSKVYALAGLRVGYAISTAAVANILNRVREPFNVNSLAQIAAIAALQDDEYLQKTIQVNAAGRVQLETGLTELGFEFIPSQGNFVTFDTRQNAAELYQKLLAKGVIVRPISPYGMPQHLRVSIGLPEENAAFLQALKEVTA